MSTAEVGYLAMVLVAFATFVAVVGFVSVWSRVPKPDAAKAGPPSTTRSHTA
jgi:hypothetical protein